MSSMSPKEKNELELSDPSLSEEVEDNEAEENLNDEPIEPGKKETLANAADTTEIDKWIGRGLKLPPVQDNGHW